MVAHRNRSKKIRGFDNRVHQRIMNMTRGLFRGHAGLLLIVLEFLYFCVVFLLLKESRVSALTIALLILLNIWIVGALVCVLTRIIYGSLEKETHLTEAAIDETLHRAELDALTGLYNHSALYLELGERIRMAEKTGAPLSVVLFDFDNFKEINDIYGHAAGDECIVILSAMLQDRVRGPELAARYGGEEFVIVLADTGLAAAASRAEIFREKIAAQQFSSGNKTFRLTVSAGVAEWEPGMDANALIELVDTRLYTAKESGRNRTYAGPTLQADDLSVLPPPSGVPAVERQKRRDTWKTAVAEPGTKLPYFLLLLRQCLYGICVWLILTVTLTQSVPALFCYLSTGVLLLLLYWLTSHAKRSRAFSSAYIAFVYGAICLALPCMYYFCGGLGSGVIMLYVLIAASASLLLSGALYAVTLFVLFVSFTSVVSFDLSHKGLVTAVTNLGGLSFLYMLTAVVLIGIALRSVCRMLYRNYQENRKFSDELMRQLEASACIDPLSGAYDRRLLHTHLEESIRLTDSGALNGFSILMFDLDHFKLINDNYGHPIGDQCIQTLARIVKKELQESDTLIRYGGEEFIVVLRGASDLIAVQRAEQIRLQVATATFSQVLENPVTLSCGVVMYRPGMNAKDLLSEADSELYHAKRNGRNQVSCRNSHPEAFRPEVAF